MKAISALLISVLLSSALAAQESRLTSARLEGNVLHLSTTGEASAVRHFPLSDPPRVVVDLYGIDRSTAELPAPAAGSPALEVRTGNHPEFVRVVVDLRAPLPNYQVRQSQGRVEIALGPAALPASAEGIVIGEASDPGAPSARPAPAPAPSVRVSERVETAADQVVDGVVVETPSPGEAEAAATATAGTNPADLLDTDDLTTDELLDLIDAELAAAGADLQESAEELIEEVEAGLAARAVRPPASTSPPRQGNDRRERLPFRWVDEEPAAPPPAEEDPDGS